MKPRDHQEEMEMPTPCESCGRWFSLEEGCGSDKWYPDTVICEQCSNLEEREIELEEEIEDVDRTISDAEYTINDQKVYKKELLEKQRKLQEEIDRYREDEE